MGNSKSNEGGRKEKKDPEGETKMLGTLLSKLTEDLPKTQRSQNICNLRVFGKK